MERKKQITFAEFRLDETSEVLWRGSQAIALRPKVFAVLKYLLEHPGQLVTKQQLLDAIWPDTYVGDAVLKDSIRQVREALGDEVKSPRFIETAHRRGYRFIGEIKAHGDATTQQSVDSERLAVPPRLHISVSPAIDLVGREAALQQMHIYLTRALGGERQVVFITGGAGIGKTTLVEAFLQEATRDASVRIGQGQSPSMVRVPAG